RSKLAAEEETAKFAHQVPVTIVRPGIVFGPRDTGFVQIAQAIRKFNFHLSPGVVSPAMSYIHVSDLVELLLAAADRGRPVPAKPPVATSASRQRNPWPTASKKPSIGALPMASCSR